jgi:hypothetical protein
MNVIARLAALLLFFTILTAPTVAQKRQTPAKPQPKPAPAPTPAPTFDNLLPADEYVVYVEVRDVGQVIRSSTLNDLLEPVMKLAGPPREFKSVVKWINAHAEQVMSSRMFIAAWPIDNGFPEALLVIEFASAEDAAKFATPLNDFLPTVLPSEQPDPPAKNAPPKPGFHLERLGSLVTIAPRPWTMKQLRPAGGKLLADDTNFRTAHNRFNSEPLFAFISFKLAEKEAEENRKRYEEERLKSEERAKQARAEAKHNPDSTSDEPVNEATATAEVTTVTGPPVAVLSAPPQTDPPPPPDVFSHTLSMLGNSFFGGESKAPDALGLALSYEGESFDLHALLINAPGEKNDPVPFWPRVIAGPPIAPESINIFPANTEMFATMSLDLPQIYTEMSTPPKREFTAYKGTATRLVAPEPEPPFKALEKQLNISIKDDLLPLFGNEVAVALPMKGLGIFGLPGPNAAKPISKENTPDETAAGHGPIVAIAVKDRERLRVLMPKLIESMGFKGASGFASTERREDTELVSYANFFAYAFVGNFLVLSPDAATTRNLVDSYLKNETLATDSQFRAYTRWQPRQLHGQFYISPALMESYRTWATQPSTRIGDQTRSLFARLTTVAQPVTYSLWNEGLGPIHELHIPKNLVAMFVAGISGEINPPEIVQKERQAMGMMYNILYAEEQYKSKKGAGSYGTLDDLAAASLFAKETLENSGYKFDLTVSGDKFEITAVPVEYGKTGSLSMFMDQTHVLRGGDHNGAAATAADPVLSMY